MYENFYHLRAKPFRLSPDPSFFFASRGHKRALAYLRYGLSQSEGFVVITGAPGTGKTTLAQILLQEMGQPDVVVAHLTTTQLDADDMLRMVLASFGLRYEGQDKAALLKTLEAFFMARSRENKQVLLVVDEAQNLPARSLEELRMLSNLHVGNKALLQTFLLGQVQFRQMLDHPDLEQLRQRVIANYHLSALGEDECHSYVESRLARVGWKDDPHFTDQAFAIIHEYTEGIPRRINMLCDRVLLFSSLEKQHEINADVLRDVTDELQSEISGEPIPRSNAHEKPPVVSDPTPIETESAAEAQQKPASGQGAQAAAKKPEKTQSKVASSTDQPLKNDPLKTEEPVVITPLPETSLPEDGGLGLAVPDDGWNQMVAQAQPDEIEVSGDGQPAEMERFRVIAGGREGGALASPEAAQVPPANQPLPKVTAPLPDAPGDPQEVVLRKILRLVLAFHRSPRSFPGLDDPGQPLPKGMRGIMELAIADDHVLSGMRQIAVMGISPAMLRAAVRFFVRRVMFLPGGDDFRVLGLPSTASLTEVETHYGLLMKLLRQDTKSSDESGASRVGEAYERLCHSEITTQPGVTDETPDDAESAVEDLDLDLSPNLGRGSEDRRARPVAMDTGGIITSEEHSAPTSRNVMLIAGAAVIVFLLYLTQVKTTETVSPDLAVAEQEKSTIVETPAVALLAEPVGTDTTAEATDSQVVEDEAMALATAKAKAEAEAEARAVAQAELATKVEEEARIKAIAEAKAEIEAQALAAARARQEAAAKAQLVAETQAAEEARVKVAARAEAAAKAKAEKEAQIKAAAAAKAKAKKVARLRAEAVAKAAAKKEAKINEVAIATAKKEAQLKAAAVVKAKTTPSTELINLDALNRMVSVFGAAYQTGDLDKLMQLHAATVRTNDQINLAGVRGKFQSLFAGTSERSIKFSNINWEREQNYARGTGQYTVSILRKGEFSTFKETGKLTLQLEKRAGKLLITRFYTSDPVVLETPKEESDKTQTTIASTNPFTRIPTKELGALLNKLINAYAAGDIDTFMALFAKDAQTNDRATVKGIREDYAGLFSSTSFRSIAFNKMEWKWDGDIAHGIGTYDVDVQPNGQSDRSHYQGQAWIQVERRDGVARITHFAFSE